jgi:hypothetical protein
MKALSSGFAYLFLAGLAFAQKAGPVSPAPSANAELPKRAPGLWRITTISPEIGMQTNEVCIENGDSLIGPQARGCAPPAISRVEDQLIVTIECGSGEGRDVESLLFTGDFTTWYRAQSRTTSGARRSGYTIDAKFLKPNCAPGK